MLRIAREPDCMLKSLRSLIELPPFSGDPCKNGFAPRNDVFRGGGNDWFDDRLGSR
jgi:hypothetical protein